MKECYIVCWILNQQKVFLLWCDGGKAPDRYICFERHGARKLLILRTMNEVIDFSKKHCYKLMLNGNVSQTVNFDKLEKILSKLNKNATVSQNMAEFFLETWNIFDDISYSTGRSVFQNGVCSLEDSNKLYEKIFFGNNLASVTPEGKQYIPVLTDNERNYINHMFRFAIKEIVELSAVALNDLS